MTVPPLSDEEVLTAIAERDPDAIALLYDRYGVQPSRWRCGCYL